MNDIRVYATVVSDGITYLPGIYTVDDLDDKATGDCDLDYDTAVNLLVDFPLRVYVYVKFVRFNDPENTVYKPISIGWE